MAEVFTKTAGWLDWYSGPSKPKFKTLISLLIKSLFIGCTSFNLPGNTKTFFNPVNGIIFCKYCCCRANYV